MIRDIENLKETDIDIKGKGFDDEDCRMLFAKNELIYRDRADFWTPLIVRGKTLFNYMQGKILDDYTRAVYEKVQRKIVIEPLLMKPRINSLVGEIMKMKRTGKIATEGGMSANEVADANLILKFFEQSIKEDELHDEMLFNGCVSCMPQALWFDLATTPYGDQMGGIIAEVLRWDSFLLSKYYKDAAGEDADEIHRIVRQSREEMIDENPDREDEIKEHFEYMDKGHITSEILEATSGLTVEDAQNLYYDIQTGLSQNGMDGRSLVVERLCPVKLKVEVAVAMETEYGDTLDYQLKPGTWSDERWEKWKSDNSDRYVFAKPEINVLWQVRWTREGLMLQNKIHWFQEHDKKGKPILPISVFTPQIINGVPTGPGIDMQQKLLMKCIAETEYLHDIRTGSGDIFTYIKGSIENYEDLPTELSIGNGIVVGDPEAMKTGKISDSINILKRSQNKTYGEYSQKVSNDLEQTDLITRSVMGATMPEQSNVAKKTEIAQAVVGYSILASNFNRTYECTKNLECMLIPYVFTREQLVQVMDDDLREMKSVMVNQEENDMEGEAVSVTNDLSSVHWKWRLVPGDDSPTAREAELKEMLIFWNTAAPALIEADDTLTSLSSVLMSMSNSTAKELGKVIADKAQAKAEQMNQQQMAQLMAELEEKRAKVDSEKIKAMRSGFSFSVTPEDLAYIPGMYQILTAGNYINTANNNQFQLPQGQEEGVAA